MSIQSIRRGGIRLSHQAHLRLAALRGRRLQHRVSQDIDTRLRTLRAFLWSMGALRFVAWTFGLPIDLMAFDSVFNWTFQIYGASFCIFYTLLLVLRKPLNATKDRE